MGAWIVDAAAREAMLFAAVGLLIGGLDDLLIDLLFLVRRAWRRSGRVPIASLPPPIEGRLAIFVPVWDEAAVIGRMLTAALARIDHADYRIYVGCYPNDPTTIAAVAAVAEAGERVRLVVGSRPGGTTKADNLNTLWQALVVDDPGAETLAVVLHDAEDVVHAAELRVFASLLGEHDVVQLPVLPLIHSGSRFVSGHYADEFAESHGKTMVIRTALKAGMPLAGTGCAIRATMLAKVAASRGGDPFDGESLVEDYELGLRLAVLGGRGCFARIADANGLVAVRSYFPGTLPAAIRQKARWMTGIALAGWDRTGWASRWWALPENWMRLRDRRAPLAIVVTAIAYLAAMLWGVSAAAHLLTGSEPPPIDALLGALLTANALILGWRLLMRMAFTWRVYGPVEGLLAAPRFLVGNYVALAAAPRAAVSYFRQLRGAPPVWDKTDHHFPDLAQAQQ